MIIRYDPGTDACTWAQAGHPAPLHARTGTTTALRRPPGPLLGALQHAEYHTSPAADALVLEPGDLLLLYTDGLVEHRCRALSQGTAPVLDLLSRVSAQPRDCPLDELLAGLHRANPDDDTCLLAVRRTRTSDKGTPR